MTPSLTCTGARLDSIRWRAGPSPIYFRMTRDERPRLIFCGPSPYEIGGAAKRARLLIGELQARGWRVTVIARVGSGFRPRKRLFGSCHIYELPGFHHRVLGAVAYMMLGLPLALLISRERSTIVALHLTSPLTLAIALKRIAKTPIVALATTSGPLGESSYLLSRSAHRRRSLRSVDAVVAQTPNQAGELARLFPSDRIRVIPNPVRQIEHPRPLKDRSEAIFFGRLSSEKGLDCLLDAWAIIASDSEATLYLLGDGGRHRSVEKRIRQRVDTSRILSKSVVIEPWNDAPAERLSEIDVFVLASESEGMSNSLLEACASGRVVVASDIPSNRDVLGADYPLMFPVGNVSELVRCLREAFSNNDLRTRVRNEVVGRVSRSHVPVVTSLIEDVLSDVTNPPRSQ